MNVKQMNSTMLAFVGDSYYDLKIRERLCRQGINKPHRLHQTAVKYVSAHAQAATVKQLVETGMLNEIELDVVKRGRNTKSRSIPKNTDVLTYMYSTAFEALIGYLYLNEQFERLDQIIEFSIELKQKEEN